MADTLTSNIALVIADLNDTFNFGSHVETNFTQIDKFMGMVDCLSTTRPTTTFKGQGIYEEDSKRYAQNLGTSASPNWTYMSHSAMSCTSSARPTSGLSIGLLGYETDTTRLIAWNGSAWEQKAFSNFSCTSSTHPASPFTGLEIYETDTGLSAVYTGSAYSYSWQQLNTSVVSSGTSSVTFSGISSKINHLMMVWNGRGDTAAVTTVPEIRFNGDSGANYLQARVEGTNGSNATGINLNQIQIGLMAAASATSGYFSSGHVLIPNWSQAGSGHTLAVTGDSMCAWAMNAADIIAGDYSGMYVPSAAMTSITVILTAGNFSSGKISLYGAM